MRKVLIIPITEKLLYESKDRSDVFARTLANILIANFSIGDANNFCEYIYDTFDDSVTTDMIDNVLDRWTMNLSQRCESAYKQLVSNGTIVECKIIGINLFIIKEIPWNI